MSNVEAIIFDLWQTLIFDNRELGRDRTRLRIEGASRVLSRAGYNFTYEHLRESFRNCYRICHAKHDIGEDYSFDEQVRIFINCIEDGLLKSLDQTYIDKINYHYAEAFFDFLPPVDPDALDLLNILNKEGYKIGLISNTGMTPGRLFRRYMEDLGILKFFDVLTFSDEVGLTKPSKEIFDITIEQLGVPRDKVVHVGDHIVNDVVGAHNADVRVILVGSAQGKEAIEKPEVHVDRLRDVPYALKILPEKY